MTMAPGSCPLPPHGWYCLKDAGHPGACLQVPRWWNVAGRLHLKDAHRR